MLIAGFFVPALKREVAHRPPKPRRETARLPLEPGHPAPAVDRRHRGHRRAAHPRHPGAELRLGFSDESNFAEDTTTKQAYDLLVDGFGVGFNGPMLLVAELPDGADEADLAADRGGGRGRPGVEFVSSRRAQRSRRPRRVPRGT